MAKTVDCEVEEDRVFGEYANAFRVVHEGDEMLLDFCIYHNDCAKLVRRLRVTQPLFRAILERMVEESRVDLLEEGLLIHDGPAAES